MGEMAIMDTTGDSKQIWDPNVPEEVAIARESFDNLKKKGYIGYTVNEDGDKGEVIHSFDPNAGKVIMAPRMVAG